jgi:vacuolar-type H+-ATPase subunit C/Vma6
MRQLAKYSFANAKIRAMLSFLLDEKKFSDLLESRDAFDVVKGLSDTAYQKVVNQVSADSLDLEKLEKEFLRYDLAVHRKVEEALSSRREKEFVGLLRQRYELEELKVVLRAWQRKIPISLADHIIEPDISYPIDFKKLISAGSIEEIILLLDHTPYKQPLLRVREKYKARNSSFFLEAALDLDYYQRLSACIDGFTAVDRKTARKIIGIEVDIENINGLIRFRKYYSLAIGEMLEWVIPGGAWITKDTVRKFYVSDGLGKVVESIAMGPYARIKELVSDNPDFIEQFLYEILHREVRLALSGFPFTIGTVLGYLILKRRETRSIISLLQAKAFGWKKEDIQNSLSI